MDSSFTYIDFNTLELTDEALDILNKKFKNKNIIYLKEELSHDGYDKYGPKSNLWDLSIIIELDDEYIFYDYHWENWFTADTVYKYDLCQSAIKLSNTDNFNIQYFQQNIEYTKFKEAYEMHIKNILI
jgi:hypothetical protein